MNDPCEGCLVLPVCSTAKYVWKVDPKKYKEIPIGLLINCDLVLFYMYDLVQEEKRIEKENT